jgi:hypothetical protein
MKNPIQQMKPEAIIKIPEFLTPRALSIRWSWHVESIRRKLRRRELESVVIGRRRLIPMSEVEKAEQAGRVPANQTN